jgi:hypothetical protein
MNLDKRNVTNGKPVQKSTVFRLPEENSVDDKSRPLFIDPPPEFFSQTYCGSAA